MSATTTRAPLQVLASTLADHYGAGLCYPSPTVILWAADRVADDFGAEFAKRALKKANSVRHKHGVPLAYPAFGDRLF